MSTFVDQTLAPAPERLIGTWRRFGETGPVYEVVDVASAIGQEQRMRIRVVETGEELDYRLADLLDDPRAA